MANAADSNKGIETEACTHCGMTYGAFRCSTISSYADAYHQVAWNREHTSKRTVLRHWAAMKREEYAQHLAFCGTDCGECDAINADDFSDDDDDDFGFDFGANDTNSDDDTNPNNETSDTMNTNDGTHINYTDSDARETLGSMSRRNMIEAIRTNYVEHALRFIDAAPHLPARTAVDTYTRTGRKFVRVFWNAKGNNLDGSILAFVRIADGQVFSPKSSTKRGKRILTNAGWHTARNRRVVCTKCNESIACMCTAVPAAAALAAFAKCVRSGGNDGPLASKLVAATEAVLYEGGTLDDLRCEATGAVPNGGRGEYARVMNIVRFVIADWNA